MEKESFRGFSAKKQSFLKKESFFKKGLLSKKSLFRKKSLLMYSTNKDPFLKRLLFGRKPPKRSWATKFQL